MCRGDIVWGVLVEIVVVEVIYLRVGWGVEGCCGSGLELSE